MSDVYVDTAVDELLNDRILSRSNRYAENGHAVSRANIRITSCL